MMKVEFYFTRYCILTCLFEAPGVCEGKELDSGTQFLHNPGMQVEY